MERITSAQPPPCVDIQGIEFPMYVYKSRRGMKRSDDSKETYKLPHRLIEKKRRDRINECIAQLKDLLPEHLKLTTLGHLEKAVVLELTLKHVKALTSLLEQQQQKIIALQNGVQIGDQPSPPPERNEEMFHSGFRMCANEVLHFLSDKERGEEASAPHLLAHLQKVVSELLEGGGGPGTEEKPAVLQQGKNCVPVIQRTYAQAGGEQSGSDTDTDSGYGGELDKTDCRATRGGGAIKQESYEPPAKRCRAESPQDECAPSSYVGFPAQQPPLCMPFYLLPPATAAAYLPLLEKCWYPGTVPLLYPGLSADKHLQTRDDTPLDMLHTLKDAKE